ncbi:MAG: hypothetical protein MUF76_06865 [Hydrogenophaga sp.]|jgi:hypothetical protein|nr:hypothetical protein [Hydrogenophaga sp.]
MSSQAEKVILLQQAALHFERELTAQAPTDQEIAAVLRGLTPLLKRIAQGQITPPVEGLYERQFYIEHPRHGDGSAIYSAEASFQSALLDWRSKPWYPE